MNKIGYNEIGKNDNNRLNSGVATRNSNENDSKINCNSDNDNTNIIVKNLDGKQYVLKSILKNSNSYNTSKKKVFINESLNTFAEIPRTTFKRRYIRENSYSNANNIITAAQSLKKTKGITCKIGLVNYVDLVRKSSRRKRNQRVSK